jgi:hypothetical protein
MSLTELLSEIIVFSTALLSLESLYWLSVTSLLTLGLHRSRIILAFPSRGKGVFSFWFAEAKTLERGSIVLWSIDKFSL